MFDFDVITGPSTIRREPPQPKRDEARHPADAARPPPADADGARRRPGVPAVAVAAPSSPL